METNITVNKSAKVLGSFLPALPDISPISKHMIDKYHIPHITSKDPDIVEIILSEEKIDWEAVRKDVEAEVHAIPDLIPEGVMKLYKELKKDAEEPDEIQGRDDIPLDIRNGYVNAYKLLVNLFKPVQIAIDQYLTILADRVIEYLMTGNSREIPNGWLGAVYTTSMMGSQTVIAMAGPMADPKELSSQFRRKYTETFGSDRPHITNENINTSQFLTWKLNGMRLNDIADIYIERHPSEFPSNPSSKSYKAAKRKLEDRLKMRMFRLQETIYKIART